MARQGIRTNLHQFLLLVLANLFVGAMVGQERSILTPSSPGRSSAAARAGLGTALVYPVLLAAVSDAAPPATRGSILGGYRLWRDAGYALAGLGIGPVTDAFGPPPTVAALAILSALAVAILMAPRLR